MIQQGDTASRRLSDVSRAHPGDVTLQNLLGQTGVPAPVIDLVAGNPTTDGLFQTLGACAS